MGYFYIVWFAVCYACSMALEAINNGWLASYGESKTKVLKNICKVMMLLSLIAVIILTVFTEIL